MAAALLALLLPATALYAPPTSIRPLPPSLDDAHRRQRCYMAGDLAGAKKPTRPAPPRAPSTAASTSRACASTAATRARRSSSTARRWRTRFISTRRRTSRACCRRGAATRARARPRSCCGTWCGRTRRGGTPGRTWGARSPTRRPERRDQVLPAGHHAGRAVERDPDTPAELVDGIRQSLARLCRLGACLADLNSDQASRPTATARCC